MSCADFFHYRFRKAVIGFELVRVLMINYFVLAMVLDCTIDALLNFKI